MVMIHLRLRSEYSFGETFLPMERIIKRLKEIGCTHAGLVDGNTWGHVRFFTACKEAGIEPILGVEICVSDDEVSTPKMWLLAKNQEGLKELYRLTSKSHQQPIADRRGSQPRLYTSDILKTSFNILKFAGEVLDGDFLAECNAFIDFNPSSRILNLKKKEIAEKHGLRTIETCDNYFAYEQDRDVFELACSGGLKPSPQYITELADNDEAILIAKSCEGLILPVAPTIRAEGDLEQICREGIKIRKMEGIWSEVYEKRLNYELDLIKLKDFESYFIIVSDMVLYAKKHMLVGPSRGSAAGSLVCYLSRITEIDPIPAGLYFERFIEHSRNDLPDIDLDFPDSKRYMVFEYMAEKYGINNTAHIGTISVFKPKSALIQVCKKLNIPPAATAAVKVAMIERSAADARANNCLADTFELTDPGRKFIEMYPNARAASIIEGHASHTGVHAAGLLVCNDEITNYATVDAKGIAHVEKGAADILKLLKIDVLGLRTLSVLEDSGIDIDWYGLKFDDKKTFDVFNEQRLCGIFQFEGNALRSISSQVEFSKISDIDAVTALARPGPFAGGVTEEYIKRKAGKKYAAIHPLVEKQMAETYGLPVYQEQTLAIVREIGKFGWEEAYMIRKAMSKRLGVEFFNKFWEKFKEGATSQGVPEQEAKKTWELINTMGSWQMNKAHTFSYAVISYWCAYLKANHPLEFAASTLRNSKDEDSAIDLLREIVKEGIEFIDFDIENSMLNWSVKDGKLLGGFLGLKGFGESKSLKAIAAREEGKLTEKQRSDILKAERLFGNIFPIKAEFGDYYKDALKFGIRGKVIEIEDLREKEMDEFVFIGELIYKNPRNANEEANVKKREGKMEKGPLEYLDLRLRDDTGVIGARINRFDYVRLGKEIVESVPVGAIMLIRAKIFNNIRYAFINKWKVLK
jgi:DNA polymerase III alpha subunit